MKQELIHETDLAGTGSQPIRRSDRLTGGGSLHHIAGIFHNAPRSSEKLTDSTLPLAWPAPYLDQLTSDEAPWGRGNAAAVPGNAPAPLPEDYAQLMRKLKADSMASQGKPQVDKALCVAHYVSTLIAALAFLAMMAILVITCFPTLLEP